MAQNAAKEIMPVTEQSAVQKTRYNSDFVEIKKLGEGGFGKVYEAKHNLDGKSYAVKKISVKQNANMAKPLREVRALARLKHENIMGYSTSWVEDNGQVFSSAAFFQGSSSNPSSDSADSTSDDVDDIQELVHLRIPPAQKNKKLLCIQMELCNLNLQDWLEERNKKLQNVSIDYGPEDLCRDVIHIFRQILRGVSFIHSKGLMHRDLKPQNIFLFGSDLHVKIGDFGLVKGVSGSDSALSSPTVEGVPIDFNTKLSEIWTGFYGSPELLGRKPCDTKCDMYSLGVILFEMCNIFTTGMERHITMTELKRVNHCPESFRKMWSESEVELIEKLISVEADRRPTSEEVLRSSMFAKELKRSAIASSSCAVPVSMGEDSHSLRPHIVMDQVCALISTMSCSQDIQTLPQPSGTLKQRVKTQDQRAKSQNQGAKTQDQRAKKLEHKSKKQYEKDKKQDQKFQRQDQKLQGQDQKFQGQDQKVIGDADQFSTEASSYAENMGYRRKQ
ncbi:hypothetical protein BsWGS_22374 [Bradybaena similaris]